MSLKQRKIVEDGHNEGEPYTNMNDEITTCEDSLDGLSFGYFKGPFADGNQIKYKSL